MKQKSTKIKFPTRTNNMPFNYRMLIEMRDELKSDIRSLEHKMDSRFDKVTSEISKMASRFEKVTSEVHRMALIAEEQNVRNKIVLDGLTSFIDLVQRHDDRITGVEKRLGVPR